MSQSLQLGTIRLDLILDERGDLDGNQIFYPAPISQWSVGLEVDAAGHVPIVVNALLIRDGQEYTLVDTGFGEEEHPDRPESVLKGLARLGVQPKQIRRVILTHEHADHACGNTLKRGDRWLPTFPFAEYVIQEQEIIASRAAGNDLWRTRFQPLLERGQLRLIHGRLDLSETLACWPTPGHTIGHQSVLIRSDGQQALCVGDLAILARNMERLEWGHSWAWSQEAHALSRREVAEWAVAQGAILIIPHDPVRPWIKLQRAEGGYRAVPLNL